MSTERSLYTSKPVTLKASVSTDGWRMSVDINGEGFLCTGTTRKEASEEQAWLMDKLLEVYSRDTDLPTDERKEQYIDMMRVARNLGAMLNTLVELWCNSNGGKDDE